MRKMIYVINETNERTTDYNVVKNLPQSAFHVEFEDVREEETKEQRKTRLERMKRKLDAIALNKASV